MGDADEHPEILIIEDDPTMASHLRAAVTIERSVECIRLDDFRCPVSPATRVVLLGPSNADDVRLAELGALRLDAGGAVIILVAEAVDVALLRASMRAKVAEVVDLAQIAQRLGLLIDGSCAGALAKPVDHGEQQTRRGHAIVVFGVKGGVGCTTAAVNLAVALRERTGAETILIDADMQFGDVSMMMRLVPERSMLDVSTSGPVTWQRVRHSLTVHDGSGVSVLTAPRDPRAAELIEVATVAGALSAACELADYVVADVPAGFSELSLALLEAADQIVLVTAADLANLKNAKLALGLLSDLGLISRTRTLVNRVGLKAHLDLRDLESVLGCHTVDHLPDSPDVITAETHREPFVVSARHSAASRAVCELADAIAAKSHLSLTERPTAASHRHRARRPHGA